MKMLVLPGNGIGEETAAASIDVPTAADRRFGLGLSFEFDEIGFKESER